ncbi:MAG TPA: hypothetical protein VK878_25675 [Candidatus Deferrimicrobiaceae bacterium]|nr:hypothetical protein [Candidatus Deferrimicrobiaceae bacterium]
MSDFRWTAMAVPIVLLAATTLVAGCATKRIVWEKAAVAQVERERDENACLRAAMGGDGGQLLVPYCIDRDVYTRCMEGRGYTVRSQ